MYESFYGLKEKPFSLLPDPAFLYLSRQHEMAVTLLEYSLENQAGFCVITGKAGTGKTTLLRQLLNRTGDEVSVGLISNTHHSFGELLRWILHAFNLEDSGDGRARQHQAFVDYLIGQYAKHRRTLLIIDEAQNMSAEALEELRMLSNINSEKDLLLQVVLVGQPPLRDILRRPELEQFAQRVAVDYHLDALSGDETRGYIRHRLLIAGGERELFTDDACEAVFRYSGGIPRLINLLCDLSLVYAYAGQAAVVTGELVEQVVSERERQGALPVFATGQAPHPEKRPAAKPARASGNRHGARDSVARHPGAGKEPVPVTDKKKTAPQTPSEHVSVAANQRQVRVVKTAPDGAAHQPAAMPESGAPGTIAEAATSGEPAAHAAATATVQHAAPVPGKRADKAPGLPVPVRPAPWRRAAPTRRIGLWRYAAVLVILVSAAVFAWHYIDRSAPMLATPEATLAARLAETVAVTAAQPATPAPASEPPSTARSAPEAPPVLVEIPDSEKQAAEEARLKQIQRERDAALVRAREAAHEREILRRAALERERALAAEHEALLARERERSAQLARAAELAVMQAHAAEQSAEARVAEAVTLPETKAEEAGSTPVAAGAAPGTTDADVVVETIAGEASRFSANPCKGPTARFLSTCE